VLDSAEKIGEGSFAEVIRAVWEGAEVAIKVQRPVYFNDKHCFWARQASTHCTIWLVNHKKAGHIFFSLFTLMLADLRTLLPGFYNIYGRSRPMLS
jgi:serine/threonine protein kinase